MYRRLRSLIVNRSLAPGTRLTESGVASMLGVSRTPVRGVFQRLQHEGYLVGSPGLAQMRPAVAPLTKDDAGELFAIVAEVEGLAARLAAGLDRVPRHALAGRLISINDQLRNAARALVPNRQRLWELDEKFHRTYVEAGSGPRLLALNASVKPQAERYERLYVSLLGREMKASIREYEAIARAIRKGDPDAAQQAVQANWRNAALRLGAAIDRVGERR
ncbi:MAG: GntR family transcriptional regulator [Gemmatimonadota bacterium]